jgi:hypothetical protein
MLPKPRTLVTGTALYESIEQELFLCTASIAIAIGSCSHDKNRVVDFGFNLMSGMKVNKKRLNSYKNNEKPKRNITSD